MYWHIQNPVKYHYSGFNNFHKKFHRRCLTGYKMHLFKPLESCRNQAINLECKSVDWLLYDGWTLVVNRLMYMRFEL